MKKRHRRMLAVAVHIPLASARLCINCDTIHDHPRRCPACASRAFWPLQRILDRPEAA